jgi:hypothetical protein
MPTTLSGAQNCDPSSKRVPQPAGSPARASPAVAGAFEAAARAVESRCTDRGTRRPALRACVRRGERCGRRAVTI